MKKIILVLLLNPFFSVAQIGINTTTPKAALDVESTDNGILIPRVQLTSSLDVTTVVNPNSGPLETSTLVYNIAAAGVAPNNVIAGFYYWNGSKWLAISASINDHDWYKIGTTSAPTDITDDMFHTGKVAIGTSTPQANAVFHVDLGTNKTDGILITGTLDPASTVPNLGAGSRMMFFPGKSAFRAGSVIGTEWNDSNVGSNSVAMGGNTIASGDYSTAMGRWSSATGNNSIAMGGWSSATGTFSTALSNSAANGFSSTSTGSSIANGDWSFSGGNLSIATGAYSFAMGNNVQALGESSVAMGGNTIASGNYSTAMGRWSSATGNNSIAMGGWSSATGEFSTALSNSNANGFMSTSTGNSTANGDWSFSGGELSIATGPYSFAMGNNVQAIGESSVAMGGNTIASGNYSTAMGRWSSATGNYSTALGIGSTASGVYSMAFGTTVTAQSYGEVSLGTFNKPYSMSASGATTFNANDHLFNLGNGNGTPHNALTVFKDGRITINEAYTLPNVDGTANQILQTDGSGNVSWQNNNNSFWSLNGNSSISEPSIPATYGTSTFGSSENFIGTKDNNDVTIGTNNIERMRIKKSSGNVGIGTSNPTERLHVFSNLDIDKSGIHGFATQTSTSADFLNIGVKGIGDGSGSYGFGVGVLGMTDINTTWNSTGVYAQLGAVNPTFSSSTSSNQALVANGNGLGRAAMFLGGNVGIGLPLTSNPSTLLHINSSTSGAFRIVDGTEANGKVLTSNATGTATWQNPTPSGFTHYLGELYLGGIIFELYKGSDGLEHGLIVALTEANRVWQTSSTLVNANRSEDGIFNTALMTGSPAATYITSLGAGWYLPSIDELNILYNNRYYANKALRLGGYTLISSTALYWSSTEYGLNSAYALFSFTGSFGPQDKTDTNTVRAIKSF